MKDVLEKLLLGILLLFLCSLPVSAADAGQKILEESFQTQLDSLMQEELEEEIPENAQEILKKLDWESLTIGKVLSLSPDAFFHLMKEILAEMIQAPGKILGRLVAVILLCALMSGLKLSVFSEDLKNVFSLVSVLCTVSFLAEPIINCIMKTIEALRQCSLFILSFIPVFSGIIAAGGNPGAGGTYNLFLFWACEFVSSIAADTLVPLLGIYFALCIVAAVVPDLALGGLTGGVKSIVCWSLGAITTAFVGFLSLQSIVSTGADSLSLRTSKFLIGSLIPVIGNVLSDALSAAQGCVRLLKGVLGSFGILVAAATFLPVLVELILWYGVVRVTSELGQMLGVLEVSAILKSAGETLAILLAIILCFALLIIVSTTLMLVMTGQ